MSDLSARTFRKGSRQTIVIQGQALEGEELQKWPSNVPSSMFHEKRKSRRVKSFDRSGISLYLIDANPFQASGSVYRDGGSS